MAFNKELFIESVRKFPAVWNPSWKKHHDPTKVNNAWDEIAKANSCSKLEAKKYWKSLQDRFVRERKVLDSRRSGSGSDALYTPT